MFSPQLERARFEGSGGYGLLASRYTFGIEDRWMQGSAPEIGKMLGTPDMQSQPDLTSTYSAVDLMRIVPLDSSRSRNS